MASESDPQDRSEITSQVQRFAHDTAARDYREICTQVLAPALLRQIARTPRRCEAVLRRVLTPSRRPRLQVAGIWLHGQQATVATLTGALTGRFLYDTTGFVRTPGGWRMDSLTALVQPR
jgi:hypothetical protein